MKEQLKLKHLAPYRPHELKFIMTCDWIEEFDYEEFDCEESEFKEGSIWTYAGEVDSDLFIPCGEGDLSRVYRRGSTYISIHSNGIKPILRPLPDLTKEIRHESEQFQFTPNEWFEIGDSENNSIEYDNGNVKLCKNIAWASFDNSGHDARMLPYGVVEKLFEWHFDVFGLIEKGLAIDINTLNKQD